MYKCAHCHDEAANHQLPIAAALWIIWILSGGECSSLKQNLMQIYCSTCSVILNVTSTPYTCSQQCLPPPLTSTVKLSLFKHAHSSPLSLAARLHRCHANHSCILTMAVLFSGHTCRYIYPDWGSNLQCLVYERTFQPTQPHHPGLILFLL